MEREQEFLDLIEKHEGILYKLSKMYSDDEESRKDLFQEILFQLWRSFSSFKKKSQFSTWMYRVALNTAITAYKKEKKKGTFLALDQNIPVSTDTRQSAKLDQFYKAVQQLNKIEKAVIFLHL